VFWATGGGSLAVISYHQEYISGMPESIRRNHRFRRNSFQKRDLTIDFMFYSGY